jgi:hypothetical protein
MILTQSQKVIVAAESMILKCQRTWVNDHSLTFADIDRLLNLPAGTSYALHVANERYRSPLGAAYELVERLGEDAVIAMLGGLPNE